VRLKPGQIRREACSTRGLITGGTIGEHFIR
jgi:hypothetical protein